MRIVVVRLERTANDDQPSLIMKLFPKLTNRNVSEMILSACGTQILLTQSTV
jgi:hypothetical protein